MRRVELQLRPHDRANFDALYLIHRQAMESYVTATWGPWDDAWQRERFRQPVSGVREEIHIDGRLAGFLETDPRPGVLWIGNLELAPEFLGRGVGTSIFGSIQEATRASGQRVGLQVLKVNVRAGKLYERLGFQVTGETATHYQMAWEAGMQATVGERRITAFLDGEDSPTISNPIHSTEVAAKYGFRGALVGGVTVYGWLTPAILEVLGERWLADGWADVRFRRPVFPGDELTAKAEKSAEGVTLSMLLPDGDTAITGKAGVGKAEWFGELREAKKRAGEPKPETVPVLTLETAPTDVELRPMPLPYSVEEASLHATNLQQDGSGRFTGEGALVHPGWIAARMTPLLKHSYDYGPSIHIRTQVQHLAPARAGPTFTRVGRFLRAYEDKGHNVAELDGSLLAENGEELARLRHTTIFRIRPPKD